MKKNNLIICFFGDGKGKTSAAMGTVLRSLQNNKKIAIIQFMKSGKDSSEITLLKKYFKNNIFFYKNGAGFLFDKKNFDKHLHKVNLCFKKTFSLFQDKYFLIILDEILTCLELNLITEKQIVSLIDNCPEKTNLILTGRKITKNIIKKSDIVSEIKKIKHCFDKGIIAKKAIDY